ncbi:MAG: hypothetical protein AAB650_00960 [Patescibacteria group bacterium]
MAPHGRITAQEKSAVNVVVEIKPRHSRLVDEKKGADGRIIKNREKKIGAAGTKDGKRIRPTKWNFWTKGKLGQRRIVSGERGEGDKRKNCEHKCSGRDLHPKFEMHVTFHALIADIV